MNKLLLSLVAFFPVLAHAHEEHGHTLLENLTHVFSNPEHVWPLTLGLVLVVVIGFVINKK
jgi:hypothetical protein